MVPDSPTPLAPSGLYGVGVAWCTTSKFGELRRRDERVVGEVAGDRVAVGVVRELLDQRLGDPLRDAAVHLPLEQQRVQHGAGVVARHVAHEPTLPVSTSTSTTARCAPNG